VNGTTSWLYDDAVAQAAAVRTGQVSPAELVEAAIARIERLDPKLGALVFERFEKARAEALAPLPDGPLRGVPFLLKDAVQHSAGDRYQHGMRLLRDHPFVSPADTELTARYRQAGVVILGRSTCPELTVSTTTEPLAHHPARNPWDVTRTAGGSSGGAAVAVAAGMVPAAHGNDMGGSIRIPASCCGLVGLKPSRDRTSPAPLHGEYWGPLTHEHVLTRTVRDSAAFLDATAGPVAGDLHAAPPPARPWLDETFVDPHPLRIGVMTQRPDGGEVDPECSAAAESAGRLLESLGHSVELFDPVGLRNDAGHAAFTTLLAVAIASDVRHWQQLVGATAELEPFTAMLDELGRGLLAVDLVAATDALGAWSRAIAASTGTVDVLVTPTLPILPPVLGELSGDRRLEDALPGQLDMSSLVMPFNVSGQPAMSLPLGQSATGLPIGVQFVAPYGREDLLFALAAQLERAAPWADRRPPLD
jgi:amidase